MSTEQRDKVRYAVRTDCLVTSRDGRMLAERTLDASWDGLRLAATGTVRVGERVHVSLRVPRSRYWLQAEGVVTRLLHGRRDGDAGPAFGVRLDRMHGMDRMLLGTALRHQHRAAPERGATRDYARAVARIHGE